MKKKIKLTVLKVTELLLAGIAISAFTAYMVFTYVPRVEERVVVKETSTGWEVRELPDSTQYQWTVMDLDRTPHEIWEISEEPVIEDGFVKFTYSRHEDWIWIPIARSRVYKQVYR